MLEIENIRNIHHTIRKNFEFTRGKEKIYKNFTQMQIVFYLVKHEGETIYQKDIGAALNLKKSSITEHLDYLESVDIIKRIEDKKDKRKNSIILSDVALEEKEEVKIKLQEINAKAIEGISKEDIDCFNRVIKKMEENLSQ